MLVGGIGFDMASYAQDTLKITIDLSTGINTAAALGDVFDSIEQFTLTQLNDVFMGMRPITAYWVRAAATLFGAPPAMTISTAAEATTF